MYLETGRRLAQQAKELSVISADGKAAIYIIIPYFSYGVKLLGSVF